jgi:hypothetical protein
MPLYLVTHMHRAEECGVAFAAWRGFDSPLRRFPTLSSCQAGGHQLWWRIEAPDEQAALAQVPWWIGQRSVVASVSEVRLP